MLFWNLTDTPNLQLLLAKLAVVPVYSAACFVLAPIFQLFRKSHLTGDALELLYRRLLIIMLAAWLPLLLLTTVFSSNGNLGRLSFFHDVEVHVRFLVALPVLVASELIVNSRIRPVVQRLLPLLLTVFSPEELMMRVIKVIF